MKIDQYKGFRNKPTWTIARWFKTEEDLYNYWKKRSEELTREELIKELKLQIEDRDNPLTEKATIYSDLLNYSIGLVEWDEIADLLKE